MYNRPINIQSMHMRYEPWRYHFKGKGKPILMPGFFELRDNPGVTRESRVTPGLRENSVLNPLTPG